MQTYMKKAGKKENRVVLTEQVTDESCMMGKLLKRSQISELAHNANPKPAGLNLVLTAEDVTVEGFCMSSCGFHGSDHETKSVFIWVGNSVAQCPGQCAWPFHQPMYGPQSPPSGAPNGDVGVDGMVVNIAILLANTLIRSEMGIIKDQPAPHLRRLRLAVGCMAREPIRVMRASSYQPTKH
ncbi:hypothetical protein Ancab_038434 [Ancistrocladus abbreviatus]